MLEILISKGVNINAKDINYQNIGILFLINGIWNKSREPIKKNQTPFYIAAVECRFEFLSHVFWYQFLQLCIWFL